MTSIFPIFQLHFYCPQIRVYAGEYRWGQFPRCLDDHRWHNHRPVWSDKQKEYLRTLTATCPADFFISRVEIDTAINHISRRYTILARLKVVRGDQFIT